MKLLSILCLAVVLFNTATAEVINYEIDEAELSNHIHEMERVLNSTNSDSLEAKALDESDEVEESHLDVYDDEDGYYTEEIAKGLMKFK